MLGMETTAIHAAASPVATAFTLAMEGKGVQAVALLHQHRADPTFAAEFKSQWAHCTGSSSERAFELANHLVAGLDRFDQPFPNLFGTILSAEANSAPTAFVKRLVQLERGASGCKCLASPEAWDVLFALAEDLLSKPDADGMMVSALAKLIRQHERRDHVARLMDLAKKIAPKSRGYAHATVALNLTSYLDCAQWTGIIAAIATEPSPQPFSVSSLAAALRLLPNVDAVSDAALRQWIQFLLDHKEQHRWLPAMLDCALGARVLKLFFGEASVLQPWEAVDTPQFVVNLVKLLISHESGPAPVISHLMAGETLHHHRAAVELAQALAEAGWVQAGDWDNTITLISQLLGRDVERACKHVVSGLMRASLLTPERARALLRLRQSMRDPGDRFELSVSLLPAGGALASADVWAELWREAKENLNAASWTQPIGAFLNAAFGFAATDVAAPMALCTEILSTSATTSSLRVWLWQLLKAPESAARLGLLFRAIVQCDGKTQRVVLDSPATLATFAAGAPEAWTAVPPAMPLPSSAPASFLADLVSRLWTARCGHPAVWRQIANWVAPLPAAEKSWLEISIRLTLDAGHKQRWYAEPVPTSPAIHDDVVAQSDAGWSKCVALALEVGQWNGRAIYQQALHQGLTTGMLGWDQIPEVQKYRAGLRKRHPSIDWDLVFRGCASKKLAPKRFCTAPQLFAVLQPWVVAIRRLAQAAIDHLQTLPVKDRAAAAVALIGRLKLLGLSLHGKPRHTDIQNWKIKGSSFDVLMTLIFGTDEECLLTEDILSKIVVMKNRTLATPIQDLLTQLQTLAPQAKAQIEQLEATRQALVAFIGRDDFPAHHDNYHLFELEILDKEHVACLVLGEEVGCCLSPGGQYRVRLLERLAGPWVLVAVKDQNGKVVAVAWCVLCMTSSGAPFLASDYTNLKRRLREVVDIDGREVILPQGGATLDALVDWLPDVGRAVGAPQVQYGTLSWEVKGWRPAITSAPQALKLTIIEPPIVDNSYYLDNAAQTNDVWIKLS